MFRKWNDLPEFMRVQEVKPYWEILNKRKGQILIKRLIDLILSVILLVAFAIPMVIIAIFIKLDSPGTVFFRQERVTTYGKRFRIHKFRTMVSNADDIGPHLTIVNDARITKVGARLRKNRLDELPQLLDVIKGDMSFVGTRPEVAKYVNQYKPEYNATLLLPAGITSEASIRFRNEDKLLKEKHDIDRVYLDEVLPEKMIWNLDSIKRFHIWKEIRTMLRTLLIVFGKEYK